jgi:hypothetical protein
MVRKNDTCAGQLLVGFRPRGRGIGNEQTILMKQNSQGYRVADPSTIGSVGLFESESRG